MSVHAPPHAVAAATTTGKRRPCAAPMAKARHGPARRLPMLLIALATGTLLPPIDRSGAQMITHSSSPSRPAQSHPYVGMWVTLDGHIRHELLPNGRYDEARGSRQSAYQGRYEVRGNHIDYWDDTGFTADGTFVDADTLHHGGMVFRRER